MAFQRLRNAAARAAGRKGAGPAPVPPSAAAGAAAVHDYPSFLRQQLALRPAAPVTSHRLDGERVWLKTAGQRHGRWRYHLLAGVAGLLRLDLLTPVPNPGGAAAIAIEARRLHALAAAGLRVPRVLAEADGGLLISDLGESGRTAPTVLERMEQAASENPVALLSEWREGLDAIAQVHAQGQYLSQAFARNLVQCPDGVIGFIDFEDDPGATLSLAQCQSRDWLSYLHSTAVLVDAAAPHAAGSHWQAALANADDTVRQRLAVAAGRMHWLRRLPASRRWGRDTQRVRAAARLLGRWYG